VLRLPMAEGTPGELVWTVMGTDTVSNLQALTYSTTVLMLLVAKGVTKSWVFPNRLAFIQTSLDVAERVSYGPHSAPASSASVAPHPLGPNLVG
jgi:hypothetical protein